MSIRTLPQINASFDELRARPLEMDVLPAAFDRWNAGLRVAAEAGADNVISIYDVIGEDPWSGGGFTAARLAGALRQIGKRDVVVNINSPGGNVFDGLAIYNLLRDHPANVTVKIVGLAASAASVIAMAGDHVEIAAAGFLMIHNTSVLVIGNRNDLRGIADELETFDRALAGIYAAHTGLGEAEIGAMMDKETWFDGAQAVAQNFADDLLPADRVKEDTKATLDFAGVYAARQVDVALAKQGLPRAKRRELVRALKTGTPNAAGSDAMPGAGGGEFAAELARAIAAFRS